MNTLAPIIQQQELTARCNNACKFCYNPERSQSVFNPRIETKKRNILIAEISANKGVMAICPTGGEPLLVGDHLFEIINIYKQAKCYISINTNGRLVNSRISTKLKDSGLNSVLVSLHGIDDLHNQMVGDKTAFQETWQGMMILKNSDISITPNFVATAKNVQGLLPVGIRLAEAGFKSMTVTPFLPSWGSTSHEQFVLHKEHYKKYFLAIKKIKEYGLKIDSTLPIPPCVLIKLFPDEWISYLDVLSPRVCMAGKSFGVISTDGCFRSCIQAPYLPEFGGNMIENYKKSWDNANKWADTVLIPEECLSCHAYDFCGAGCRTGCMWDNKGSIKGKTMYMGEPLEKEQAEFFSKRLIVNNPPHSKDQLYRWKPIVKFRNEGWGVIAFNPNNQSFTILSGDINDYTKQDSGIIFNSSKTARVLLAADLIEKTEKKKSNICNSKILPANHLLPRLAKNLTNTEFVYCLRADTGERYFF